MAAVLFPCHENIGVDPYYQLDIVIFSTYQWKCTYVDDIIDHVMWAGKPYVLHRSTHKFGFFSYSHCLTVMAAVLFPGHQLIGVDLYFRHYIVFFPHCEWKCTFGDDVIDHVIWAWTQPPQPGSNTFLYSGGKYLSTHEVSCSGAFHLNKCSGLPL